MDWKKLWPEVLVIIGIIVEFSIKRLQEIEQSNEKTTVVSLLLAVLIALAARHFSGGATPASKDSTYPPGTGANPMNRR